MAFPDPNNPADKVATANRAASVLLNGSVPAPVFASSLYSVEGRGGRYEVFGCTIAYETDEGLLQCPVAADVTPTPFSSANSCDLPTSSQRTSCVFVRLHAPIATKTVIYYAQRIGDPPLLPARDCDDPNLVLRNSKIIPEVKILDASGNLYVGGVMIVYWYGLKQPVSQKDGFAVGAAPFTQAAKTDGDLLPAQFVHSLV